jgi:hypothetical protein
MNNNDILLNKIACDMYKFVKENNINFDEEEEEEDDEWEDWECEVDEDIINLNRGER